MTGLVSLVGAGPGDPGLLTLRAVRRLEAADVVVHDYLVGERLLAHVRPDAEVVSVGRVHGHAGRLGQAEIEALLIDRARAGRRVVRLKNGDPFLFGRGGEECDALRRAGVPFEVVPGVTSALAVAAYAGIPATHREHASLVTIVTGHQALAAAGDQPGPPALPWAALARQGGTLVVLMGMSQLPAILDALAAHGLAGDTPAAAIQWGTTGLQATVVGTVATLAAGVQSAGLGAPGVVVVGAVVGLRDRLQWFETRPLFGRRIVVTRPRAQAAGLAEPLEDAGAEVVLFPTIALAPPADPAPLARAVDGAAGYDWILFTSANGVRAFFERFAAAGRDIRDLKPVRFGVIGPETAAALGRHLVRPAVQAAEFRAEGLLAALGGDAVRGRRVLVPRAAGAREILPETLRARGATVDEVIAYEAVVPSGVDVEALRAALEAGALDALTFTSSSTVRNFVALVGADAVARVARGPRPVIACIGPITADAARACGLPVDVVPRDYTAAALADALVDHFCKREADPLSRGAS
jgi:uroporphyrinogen III methyltransferase/synthase